IFDFEYEGHVYRIQRYKERDKSTLLEFDIQTIEGSWRPLTERSVRETESRIEQVLRMDYETFTNASFFLQGKADQFAQQRPSERKRILSSILGLEIWEIYRERSAEKRKSLEYELSILDGQLEEIINELKQEIPRREKLKTLEDSLASLTALRQSKETSLDHLRRLSAPLEEQKKWVSTLKQQWLSGKEKLEKKHTELSQRQVEYEQYKYKIENADLIKSAYQKWMEDVESLKTWDKTAADFHQHEKLRSAPLLEIETERARLQQEQQHLSDRSSQIDELGNLLTSWLDEIEKNKTAMSVHTAQLQTLTELRESLNNILQTQSEAQAENKQLRQEMNELKERITRLNETSGALCPLCGQPLNADDRERLIKSLGEQGHDMGDRYRFNQNQVNEISRQRQEMEERLQKLPALETELRTQQRLLDQLLDREKLAQDDIKDWQENGAQRLILIQNILETDNFAIEARKSLAQIDNELKQMGYDAAQHDAIRLEEQTGREAAEQYRLLEIAIASLAPLEREIKNLQENIAGDGYELTHQESSYQQALEKYQKDSNALPDIFTAQSELLNIQEQENRVRMEVGAANQQVEVLKTLEIRKQGLNKKREELQRRIGQIKLLERAFGKDGIPALLIEQALPEIESQANEILDRLSLGGMSVSFSTQKDYKDKNRDDKKETLDILISDAAGKREYEMFSGGEAFRVNFAIRLALSRVLAQRAGARLRMLVIDEGFGSQDVDGRQRLVQAINLVQSDFSKILVITHLEELKDAFPARIEVEKLNSGSNIKVLI
ncbi:MAG: SMC family ATPase, partial [Anaerolineae bacterium]|nr:SMC family ATPase [Anaerolineae bacterium]